MLPPSGRRKEDLRAGHQGLRPVCLLPGLLALVHWLWGTRLALGVDLELRNGQWLPWLNQGITHSSAVYTPQVSPWH